jgi:uncharacterized protein YbjT (DUF2867 family)
MRIAVAGATGRVGRHIHQVLEELGHDVVPMSRSHGVDLISGAGLDAALEGVECIVDAATGPSPDRQEASAFFTSAARNLQEAGARAGVRRIVMISIIGIERFAEGYYPAKVLHEETAKAGPVPVVILRAAQFHEFVEQLMGWGTVGEVAYLPDMRTQLVAARDVAEVAVGLATDPRPTPVPAPVIEVAGPRAERLVTAATLAAAKRGAPLKVEQVTDSDDHDAVLMREGALLPGPGAELVGPTFEDWLERQP